MVVVTYLVTKLFSAVALQLAAVIVIVVFDLLTLYKAIRQHLKDNFSFYYMKHFSVNL